jgi:hypothetical protein
MNPNHSILCICSECKNDTDYMYCRNCWDSSSGYLLCLDCEENLKDLD